MHKVKILFYIFIATFTGIQSTSALLNSGSSSLYSPDKNFERKEAASSGSWFSDMWETLQGFIIIAIKLALLAVLLIIVWKIIQLLFEIY